jgi:dTMP kinase
VSGGEGKGDKGRTGAFWDGVIMIENKYKGILIALDGPNGSGKTTIIKTIKEMLENRGYDVCITNEPTTTELGVYVRKFAETHEGISLACLVAVDRYEHIKNLIIPELKKGSIVITDRYILSSLILQEMDGVETGFILKINSNIIKPDLQVAVYADEKILQERLGKREVLTRFEKNNRSNDELFYMKKGIKTLLNEGVEILEICNNGELEENVNKVVSCVEYMWRKH